MTTTGFEISEVISASPEAIYDAWTSAEGHTAMTGASATSDAQVGGKFTAWDDYIQGTYTALERPTRIAMTWRTSEFKASQVDSIVEVRLEPDRNGTRVTITHSELVKADAPRYRQGWVDYYFDPMEDHFGGGDAAA